MSSKSYMQHHLSATAHALKAGFNALRKPSKSESDAPNAAAIDRKQAGRFERSKQKLGEAIKATKQEYKAYRAESKQHASEQPTTSRPLSQRNSQEATSKFIPAALQPGSPSIRKEIRSLEKDIQRLRNQEEKVHAELDTLPPSPQEAKTPNFKLLSLANQQHKLSTDILMQEAELECYKAEKNKDLSPEDKNKTYTQALGKQMACLMERVKQLNVDLNELNRTASPGAEQAALKNAYEAEFQKRGSQLQEIVEGLKNNPAVNGQLIQQAD